MFGAYISFRMQKGVDPHDFCMKKGILGVGWCVTSRENPETPMGWERYCSLAKEEGYDKGNNWRAAMNALHDRMNVGDLCWSKDPRGNYYLKRITGGWEYRGAADHYDADIVNVRKCEWHRVGRAIPENMAKDMVNNFRGQTVCRIRNEDINSYSFRLFNKLTGKPTYTIPE